MLSDRMVEIYQRLIEEERRENIRVRIKYMKWRKKNGEDK